MIIVENISNCQWHNYGRQSGHCLWAPTQRGVPASGADFWKQYHSSSFWLIVNSIKLN